MRTVTAARRSVAVLAATALVSTGGLVTGAFVGVANAQTATSVTPSAVSNASTSPTAFTVNGVGFLPNATVMLVPTKAGDEVKNITGTVDTINSTTTALKVTAPLTMVAPEPYDVVVSQTGSPASTCLGCLTVTNPGNPTVNGVVKDAGDGFMTISGTNFAIGAKVTFLDPSTLVADPAMTFTAGRDGTDSTGSPVHTPGYVSTTVLKGHYTPGAGAAAGRHILRVTNLDTFASADPVDFWQPKYLSTAPPALGQGASNIPVTVNGDGIRLGSVFGIGQFSSSKSDITTGNATVAADHKSLTAPVSVGTNGGASTRGITVTGPDGGFVSQGSLNVTVGPNPSGGLNVTSFGQGAHAVPATITGTGFQSGIVFDVIGGGVSIATQTVSGDGKTATVAVTVAPDTTVGGRTTLSATNPDHGVGSLVGDGTPVVSPFPVTIDAAPVLTGIRPGATTGPQTGKKITLTGTGFDSTNGMTVTFGAGITTTNVSVLSATSAVATIDVGSATPGPRDVVLTNLGDKGSSTCSQCFGVDSLSVNPTAAANTNNAVHLSFTAAPSTSLAGASKAVLHKLGSPSYQPDIVGTTPTSSSTTADSTFDLSNAAPGVYNAVVTATGGDLSCTGCFTITAPDFTVSGVTPANGGQGATDFPITLHGTGFSRGEGITIPGTTVSATTFVNSTTLTATITIPAAATPGQVDVTVSSADGAFSHTVTKGYTIVLGPVVTGASTPASNHKNLGQGATNQQVAISGANFTALSKVTFSGADVTATTAFVDATHLVATVAVGGTAATGDRDVTVTNTDNGGKGSKAGLITITNRPLPSSVAPAWLAAGKSTPMTITGQGFQSDSTPVIANVSFSGTTLNPNGTLSTTATVAANAVGGTRAVTIINTDGGQGSCSCFTVAIPTTLTSAILPTVTSGAWVTPGGRLVNSSTGSPLVGAPVLVKFTPAFGPVATRTITTSGSGSWWYSFRPTYTTKIAASYAGVGTTLASTAPVRTVNVAPKITVTSPRNGSSSSAASTLLVKGSVAPNKYRQTVYLVKNVNGKLYVVSRTKVASNSTYSFSVKPVRGTYVFTVTIGVSNGNVGGTSGKFTIRRT